MTEQPAPPQPEQPAPPVAPVPPKRGLRDRPLWQKILLVIVGLFIVAAVVGVIRGPTAPRPATGAGSTPGTAVPTPVVPGAATPRAATPIPATATPAPAVGLEARLGAPVTVSEGGAPVLEITVHEATYQTSFAGQFSDDEPASGNAYYGFRVEYRAVGPGADYNPFDWQAFGDDQAAESAFVINGPEPGLSSGTLPSGRTAGGWIVFEGPADPAAVTLSYKGNIFNDEPVFELTVTCCP